MINLSILHIVPWDTISNELAVRFCGIKVKWAIGPMCSHHITLIPGYVFLISKILLFKIFRFLIKQLHAQILIILLLISLTKLLEGISYSLAVKYKYIFNSDQAISSISEEMWLHYEADLTGILRKWPCVHTLLPSESFEGLLSNSPITNYCHWKFCLELGLSKHVTAS